MQSISEREKKVLFAVELDAEKPITQVAKEVGLKGHTLRYALERLHEHQVIAKRTFINIYPLGYADYAIYFSLAPDKQSTKDDLLKFLTNADVVSWLAFFGGEYQYGMAISAKNAAHVQKFLDVVSEKFPGIFFHKSLSIRTGLTLISRKYLNPASSKIKTVHFGYIERSVTIDEKDHALLAGLESRDVSLRDLSTQLKIPLTTIQQRVSALKKRGIIEGSIYQVDATKFGMQAFRFLIEAKSVNKKTRDALYEFSIKHPYICYCIDCLGSWDYELGVEVPRGDDAVETQQELYKRFGNELISVKILPLFGHLKLKNYPFR